MIPLTPLMLLAAALITAPAMLDTIQGSTSLATALQTYLVVTIIIWAATSLTHHLFLPPAHERRNTRNTTESDSGLDGPGSGEAVEG